MTYGNQIISKARKWFNNPHNSLMLKEQQLIDDIAKHLIGNYWLHIGAATVSAPLRSKFIYLGENADYCDAICDENALPITPNYVDVVLLHHALDFATNPHNLLEQATISIRDGGQIVIIGLNPGSFLGIKRFFGDEVLRRAKFIAPIIAGYWLQDLHFVVTHKRFTSKHIFGDSYLLIARKMSLAAHDNLIKSTSWQQSMINTNTAVANNKQL